MEPKQLYKRDMESQLICDCEQCVSFKTINSRSFKTVVTHFCDFWEARVKHTNDRLYTNLLLSKVFDAI